jgi:hypothetical protein
MALPTKVVLSEFIWRRKWWVMYLIVVDDLFRQVEIDPGRAFEEVTFKYVKSYIDEGKMPPPEIAGAILNMADDYLAGRQVAVRAGDYIAIQNFLRSGDKPSQ